MLKNKKIICIIPARLNSKRFPQKILAPLTGKPILQHVWEAAKKIDLFDEVLIAIDAKKTEDFLKNMDANYIWTSPNCPSGTQRLIEVFLKEKISGDIWVNWQADEPFINSKIIARLLNNIEDKTTDIWTLKTRLSDPHEILSPNTVKVVTDKRNYALYFSRHPIPFHRDQQSNPIIYKHIGIYAYTATTLSKIITLKTTYLEEAEKLEQLTFLSHGLKIKVNEIYENPIGIDTPEDLQLAEKLKKQHYDNLLTKNIY